MLVVRNWVQVDWSLEARKKFVKLVAYSSSKKESSNRIIVLDARRLTITRSLVLVKDEWTSLLL
jgi:hypothetical protein